MLSGHVREMWTSANLNARLFSFDRATTRPTRPSAPITRRARSTHVCVSSNGTELTVLYNQSVVTQCRGFAYVQLWYEPGQFIKTIALAPNGTPLGAMTPVSGDCIAAIIGSALLVIQPELTWVWVASAAVAGYSLHTCVSQ